jgi:ureidoacrylate peracid hydrolase
MLNDFCDEEGKLGNAAALDLCESQNLVLDAARRCGGTVVFVNEQHRVNLGPKREFAKQMTHTYEGSWGARVVEPLVVQDTDIEVVKRRYSGFFQSDLDLVLRDRGVTTVVLMGVLTNICVRATAHDAFFLGYDVVVPTDTVRAMTSMEQHASLYDISTHFGWVTTSDEVRASLASGLPIMNQMMEPTVPA